MSVTELSLIDAFKTRKSVRTFKNSFPEEKNQIVNQIVNEVNTLVCPFGTTDTIVSVRGPGLGKMGFVAGEAGWLLLQVPKDHPKHEQALMDASYKGQIAVMRLQQNGIGTVWMAGTYSRSLAEQGTPGYTVECVVAFGLEDSPRFFEKTIKFFGNSSSRKPFNEIAYNLDKSEPFTEENAGDKKELISALRSGPSAVNQQPWRFVFEGPLIHVYCGTAKYNTTFDIGIALANIALLTERTNQPSFTLRENAPQSPIGGTYVCTFSME